MLDLLLIHYSYAPLDHLSFRDQSKSAVKPKGLWVSVENGNDDGWKDWCLSEEFKLRNLNSESEVVLKTEAKILILKSIADIHAFTEMYKTKPPYIKDCSEVYNGTTYINWSAVAEKHQGIIITPYQYGCRLNDNCFWYYGWDCASGCIWDPMAIKEVNLRIRA